MKTTTRDWKALARSMGMTAESAFERISRNTRRMLGADTPIRIQVYQAYGTTARLCLSGRVLNCKPPDAEQIDTLWRNLKASYRRFQTNELPDVPVTLRVEEQSVQTVLTDDEGYFAFDIMLAECGLHSDLVHHSIQLWTEAGALSATADVTVQWVDNNARLGIISDIDDTILITEATSLVRMIRLTLLESSRTRVAFDGVAEFYQALKGQSNPFFYVSSSPWNLHQFLTDFMTLNGIPLGAMFLRDFGLDETKWVAGTHKAHKLDAIETILAHTADLPFVLCGDSGQRDPEVYAEIAKRHPQRIRVIYIRDVSDAFRDREVQATIVALEALGIDMLLVPDTQAAMAHAVANGFIAQRQ